MGIHPTFHLLDVSHYVFVGNLAEITISQHYSQVKVGISILKKNWMQFYLFIFVFHCWGKTDEKGTTTLSYTFIILLGDLNLYSIIIS